MATNQQFLDRVRQSLDNDGFIKLSLGNYRGSEAELKNIYIKPVMIKRALKLSFVYRYQRRDITKNHTVEEGLNLLTELLREDNFGAGTLFTEKENLNYQMQKNGKWILRSDAPTAKKSHSLTHDHQKERKIGAENKRYLQELRLTDADGKVYKNAQDKWKQINHYIEILSKVLEELPQKEELHIVDMGAGKGYLTFALYDFLNNELKKEARIEGIEYRQDLVDLCNDVAVRSQMDKLVFRQGTIEDYVPTSSLDVLIALHACDTATDDAIFKGITHEASLIVVAPCCHKQIRKEIEKNKPKNDLDFMTKHGIFLERHAEMLTDGVRALLLEYHGYQTKVVQFVSDMHTPKNAMIIATKKSVSSTKQAEISEKLQSLKAYFGIGYHHLERLLGL